MKKIRVCFSRTKSFNPVSIFFQKIEGVPFSHASIFIDSTDSIPLYAHVNHLNVHVNTHTYFEKKNEVVKSIEFEIEDYYFDIGMKEIERYEGAHYGYLTVFGIGLSRLLKKFGINLKNYFKDKNGSFFCTEFVWFIITVMNIDTQGFDPELDATKKLYEVLIQSSKKAQV